MSGFQVLYVAGPGRSGSTLITDVLGQVDGWANIGEVMFLWRNRRPGTGRSCGCGLALDACPFWGEVAREVPEALDLSPQAFELVYASRASHHWPGLLARAAREDAAFIEWRDALGAIYGAVAKLASARVVVDSSKQPGPGLVATAQSTAPLSILQLTRDPRAVAYSWLEPKVNPDRPEERLFAMRPARSAYDWVTQSLATEWVLRPRVGTGRFRRLAYEELAAHPRASVAGVVAWMGNPGASLPFTGERSVRVEPTHSIAGNPNRLGPVDREIHASDAWRAELPRQKRWLVGAVTSPLRWRYGYR